MGTTDKPQDDAKAMKAEYIKGATIDELAGKYNHTSKEVEAIVVDEVADPAPNPTQAELDAEPAAKKGK
jgi:hypothetical protein